MDNVRMTNRVRIRHIGKIKNLKQTRGTVGLLRKLVESAWGVEPHAIRTTALFLFVDREIWKRDMMPFSTCEKIEKIEHDSK